MFFHAITTFAFVAQASAYYFFPAVQDGQTPVGLTPPWRPPKHWPVRATLYPPPHAQDLVKPILGNVSTERMRNDLVEFTSFETRHSQSKVRLIQPLRMQGTEERHADWKRKPALACEQNH
jgi:hypothetical protein